MANSDHCYMLAAVIYIGQNHSTYAFSFRNKFEQNPMEVTIPRWQLKYYPLTNKVHVPTCVLFTKDKKFRAFGFDAEEQYSNLVLDDKQGDYYFFRRFKMKMFNQMISTRNLLIEDERGKIMPATDVIAACLKYFSVHLVAYLRNRSIFLSSKDVRWILTFPATKSLLYKHFMQTAAIKAGINDEKLVVVSEPVAASVCCHYHSLLDIEKAERFVLFFAKAKYLVLDAGGDSIDITVHEVQENNSLKQIYTARYEDCGGTYIDKAFLSLLADMFGSDFMEKFETTKMEDYLGLLREFEVKKRIINNTISEKATFKVPCSLYKDFEQMNGISIAEHIKTKPQYKERVIFIGGKLRIDANLVKDLYTGTCEIIIGRLKKLFEKNLFTDIATILMVGGFSESSILQSLIKETFPDKKIIIPDEPEFAILKGAVALGHKLEIINVVVPSGYVPTRFSEK